MFLFLNETRIKGYESNEDLYEIQMAPCSSADRTLIFKNTDSFTLVHIVYLEKYPSSFSLFYSRRLFLLPSPVYSPKFFWWSPIQIPDFSAYEDQPKSASCRKTKPLMNLPKMAFFFFLKAFSTLQITKKLENILTCLCIQCQHLIQGN